MQWAKPCLENYVESSLRSRSKSQNACWRWRVHPPLFLSFELFILPIFHGKFKNTDAAFYKTTKLTCLRVAHRLIPQTTRRQPQGTEGGISISGPHHPANVLDGTGLESYLPETVHLQANAAQCCELCQAFWAFAAFAADKWKLKPIPTEIPTEIWIFYHPRHGNREPDLQLVVSGAKSRLFTCPGEPNI